MCLFDKTCVHVQNHTNALLLAIAKEGQERVVDALLDREPELDLQDSVCFKEHKYNTAVNIRISCCSPSMVKQHSYLPAS